MCSRPVRGLGVGFGPGGKSVVPGRRVVRRPGLVCSRWAGRVFAPAGLGSAGGGCVSGSDVFGAVVRVSAVAQDVGHGGQERGGAEGGGECEHSCGPAAGQGQGVHVVVGDDADRSARGGALHGLAAVGVGGVLGVESGVDGQLSVRCGGGQG